MTLTEQIRQILTAATNPLTRSEIYKKADLAANEKEVGSALHALLNAAEIEQLAPTRPGASNRFQIIGSVTKAISPNQPPAVVPSSTEQQTEITRLTAELQAANNRIFDLTEQNELLAEELEDCRTGTSLAPAPNTQIPSTPILPPQNMGKAIRLFNIVCDRNLSEKEGWLFLVALQLNYASDPKQGDNTALIEGFSALSQARLAA